MPFSSFRESRFRLWLTIGADFLAREALCNTLRVHNLADDAVQLIPRVTFPFFTHNGIRVKEYNPLGDCVTPSQFTGRKARH